MSYTDDRDFRKSLHGGLIGLVLLALLASTSDDLYGYEIARRLALAHGGDPLFSEGAIYPVLRALSASGLLTSRIVPSYSGPPRRYYRITTSGRKALARRSSLWAETRRFVDGFLADAGQRSGADGAAVLAPAPSGVTAPPSA